MILMRSSQDQSKPIPGAYIDSDGSGPVLKGSADSISGQHTDNGIAFEGTYPLGSGVYRVIRIECFLSVSLARYGINENDYRETNTAAWERILLGKESWKFRATKQ